MKILLLSVFAFAVLLSMALADDRRVTPYGDYCVWCSTYGACRYPLSQQEAIQVIERYYMQKGYAVSNPYHKGRFIEVEIYKDNKLIDKVLFDRKTGRLRSIY